MRERERNVFTNSFDSPYTYRIIPSRFDTISKQSPRHSRSVVDSWCTVSVKASRFHPEKKERERERAYSLGGRLSWRRTSGFRARVKRIVDRRRGKLRHARNIEQRNNGDSGPPFDERRVPISNLPFREKGGKWYLDLVFEDCPHVTEPNRRLVYPDVRLNMHEAGRWDESLHDYDCGFSEFLLPLSYSLRGVWRYFGFLEKNETKLEKVCIVQYAIYKRMKMYEIDVVVKHDYQVIIICSKDRNSKNYRNERSVELILRFS